MTEGAAAGSGAVVCGSHGGSLSGSKKGEELSGEEVDLLVRSKKKARPSGDGVDRDVMDTNDQGERQIAQPEKEKDVRGIASRIPNISYKEKLLNVNGLHKNVSVSEETSMWEDDFDKEEDDPVIPIEEQDPLCPIIEVSLEERKEWSKP